MATCKPSLQLNSSGAKLFQVRRMKIRSRLLDTGQGSAWMFVWATLGTVQSCSYLGIPGSAMTRMKMPISCTVLLISFEAAIVCLPVLEGVDLILDLDIHRSSQGQEKLLGVFLKKAVFTVPFPWSFWCVTESNSLAFFLSFTGFWYAGCFRVLIMLLPVLGREQFLLEGRFGWKLCNQNKVQTNAANKCIPDPRWTDTCDGPYLPRLWMNISGS